MYVPPGFAIVTPYLMAADADALIGFLIAAFDAEEIGRSVQGGRIANCQLRFAGTTVIMIGAAPDPGKASRAALYLYVADADATMARALAAGGTAIMPVSDMPYGDRQGGIEDPAGNSWWISQRLVEGAYF